MDLQRHEGTVKDIILVAQGEMALEEFLKQVTHTPRRKGMTIRLFPL